MSGPPRVGGPVTWAAVPFKGPIGSKRRLAPLLDQDERAWLSLAMLDDVLDAVAGLVPGQRRIIPVPVPPVLERQLHVVELQPRRRRLAPARGASPRRRSASKNEARR